MPGPRTLRAWLDRRPPARPDTGDEPPVVARMVVEIRSDGAWTIARGALEDQLTGERVAIEAEGGTPAELARSLAASLLDLPLLVAPLRGARRVVRGVTRTLFPHAPGLAPPAASARLGRPSEPPPAGPPTDPR